MAATIRHWDAVIELLGRIYGSVAAKKHVCDLHDLLEALRTQPPALKALWKKLVQQKVPLRLLKACAQQLQSLDGLSHHAAGAAARVANVFLAAATKTGAAQTYTGRQVLSGSSSGCGGESAAAQRASSSTASSSTSSALGASLLLQLQQSGLLEQLPAALSAATQQLQRLAAAAKAGQGGTVDALQPSQQFMTTMLLDLAYNMVLLPPEQNNGVVFVPLPAVAGLVLGSLRYLTCFAAAQAAGQQQQGAWQPQSQMLQQWLGSIQDATQIVVANLNIDLNAFRERKVLLARANSSSSSSAALPQATAAADAAAEQMLCSEECFLCLAVWTVALALPFAATPAQQLVGGISSSNGSGGSSSSGNSGSSSSSSGGKASRQAGQQRHDQGAGCLTSQLPTQLMAVLQQAGCSADVINGMAQQAKQSRATACVQFDIASRTCFGFAEGQGFVLGLLQGRQQLGRFALLHKLMCAALLQLARMIASCSVPHMDCCSKGCVAAFSVLQQAQRLEQLQAQSSSDSRDTGNPNSSSNPDQHMSEQQQQAVVHSSCLQAAQDLLQHLLQLWGSATAVLTATDAPIGLRLPGSSSSGASSADQAAVPEVLQDADGPIVLRSISRIINMLSAVLLPLLCDCHAAEGPAQGANAGEQDVLTAVRLCSLLSQQTRASIEAVQFSGSSSAVALRQSGQLLAATLQAAAADFLHALQGMALSRGVWQQLIKAAVVSFVPGSPEQRHLFDLLCSLLKLCSIDSNMLQQQPGFDLAGILSIVWCVAFVAGAHVDCAAKHIMDGTAATQAAGTAAATASGAAAAAFPAEQDTAATAAGSSTCCPRPTAMLPWLVLLGRCWLLWARWLQQLGTLAAAAAGSAQEQLAAQQAKQAMKSAWDGKKAAEAAADPCSLLSGQCYIKPTPASKLHCVRARLGGTMGLSAVIHDTAVSAIEWLEAGSNMQQLANLGYNLQPLLAALLQLRADAAAIQTAAHAVKTQQQQTDAERAAVEAIYIAERTSLIGLCPQLQVVGQALTAFAMPLACNNPGCVNASGPSEARLVGGKSCVCAGCLTARYCSRACLKQHWKVHKPVCKALAAAAAAAAGSQAAAAVNTQHASG